MRWALIEGGTVANVVEQDDAPQIPGTWVACGDAGPGWLFDGSSFTDPRPLPSSAPQSVTMRQARMALLAAGKLSQVESAIDALPEPNRTAARIEWEYSNEVQRGNSFVALLGAALSMSESELDALFTQAATL
jgi:hypothetical protein